jgi:hypothetical protein
MEGSGLVYIDKDVHHPSYRDGRNVIAIVELTFLVADIALAQLKPSLAYFTTSFDGDENNAKSWRDLGILWKCLR